MLNTLAFSVVTQRATVKIPPNSQSPIQHYGLKYFSRSRKLETSTKCVTITSYKISSEIEQNTMHNTFSMLHRLYYCKIIIKPTFAHHVLPRLLDPFL